MNDISQKISKKSVIIFILIFLIFAGVVFGVIWHYDFFGMRSGAGKAKGLYRDRFERYKISLVKLFSFPDERALKEWEEKIFKGKVVYEVGKDKALSYVKATSDASASALYYKINMDVKERHPVISWRWNVEKFPQKKSGESIEAESEDDFAARVYVIFPAKFILNSHVLEYIWSETLPAGSMGTSPYSKSIKLIVARSGPNPDKRWFCEERDIAEDYTKAFGRSPARGIGAVAFMTNTEHTGTSAVSMYTDIKLGYREDEP